MRKASSSFGRGGVYVCRICKRNTRATGRGDSTLSLLCAECYDLVGIENAFSDSCSVEETAQVTSSYLDMAQALLEDCIKKGGKTKAADWNIPGLK